MAAEVLLRTLRHLWLALEPLQTPMAVMGGLALAVWNYVRATRDVDLLISVEKLDADLILSMLAEKGVRAKKNPPIQELGSLRIIQLLYEPPGTFLDLQIDLLIADSDYQRHALARRIPAKLPELDMEIFVLTCEDLILHKLLAARIIDKADAVALLRTNQSRLDFDYLHDWVARLNVSSEWLDVKKEAIPGLE